MKSIFRNSYAFELSFFGWPVTDTLEPTYRHCPALPLSFQAAHVAAAAAHAQQHRRTGSSVIETLQTLTCSGAETDRREESIAQFLENLKKEQQEK